MLPIDLSGKIALVTGATGEIGRVIVHTLARSGADVVIHYRRNRAKAAALVGEVEGHGVRALMAQADVTQEAEIRAMREAILTGLGAPQILVNNAVMQYRPWTSVLEQSLEDYESQFRSCVMQNVLMAKTFVPDMIRECYGRIIAISTECALQNFPNQSAYVAGKRGMDGILRVLAREIGAHQITVNQVAPGWTITDRVRDAGSQHQPAYEATVPLRRRGEDQEIANVVAFLASDLASYITGAFIPVCGGNVMPAI